MAGKLSLVMSLSTKSEFLALRIESLLTYIDISFTTNKKHIASYIMLDIKTTSKFGTVIRVFSTEVDQVAIVLLSSV